MKSVCLQHTDFPAPAPIRRRRGRLGVLLIVGLAWLPAPAGGAETGIYDFNVNMRGFNGPLTRRIAVLVDGRDPSIPFLGAQEWASFSLPLDDLETLEVARGPSAALYGPNASSGVLNFITKPPRSSPGAMLRLAAREFATANLDLRWAGETLGRQRRAEGKRAGGWWKLLASSRSSDTFAVSRRGQGEYAVPCPSQNPCLPQEVVDPADRVEGWAGSVRFDRNFGEVTTLGAELAGRYSGKRWNFSASTSFFDFDLERSLPGLDQVLSPNAPEHQARAAVTFTGERLDFDLSGRWAADFFWASGVFVGDVPSYTTFDLSSNYRWNDRLGVGVHVSNLLDESHHEAFGGDLIGRRALGSFTFRW